MCRKDLEEGEPEHEPEEDDQLVCFKCGYQVERRSDGESVRFLMYSHFVQHYQPQLGRHVLPDRQTCRLCSQQSSRKFILHHVALEHDLLDPLLPPEQRIPKELAAAGGTIMAATAPGGATQLTTCCPLCGLVLDNQPRSQLYQHFIAHFRTELSAFTAGRCCQLCGEKQCSRRSLLQHVGRHHGILNQLLLPHVVPALQEEGGRAAEEDVKNDVMLTEAELKMEVDDEECEVKL